MQPEPYHPEDHESSIRKAPNSFEKIKFNLLNLSKNIIKEIKLRTFDTLQKLEEHNARGLRFKDKDFLKSISSFSDFIHKFFTNEFVDEAILEEIQNIYKQKAESLQKRDIEPQAISKETRQVNENQVYVSGLTANITTDDLNSLFAGCGPITSVIVPGEGQSRGFAFVTFMTGEGAQSACQLNGSNFKGRPIKVQLSWQKNDNNRKVETTNTVFVGNLNFYTTEASLFEFFNGVGEIKTVRLARDSNGNVKGFAHVEFYFPHQAYEALKLNENLLGGRQVRVELAGSKKSETQTYSRSNVRYYNAPSHYPGYQYNH